MEKPEPSILEQIQDLFVKYVAPIEKTPPKEDLRPFIGVPKDFKPTRSNRDEDYLQKQVQFKVRVFQHGLGIEDGWVHNMSNIVWFNSDGEYIADSVTPHDRWVREATYRGSSSEAKDGWASAFIIKKQKKIIERTYGNTSNPNNPRWKYFLESKKEHYEDVLQIVRPGDYIITWSDGSRCAMKPQEFESKFYNKSEEV